jgi:hypothetical protein
LPANGARRHWHNLPYICRIEENMNINTACLQILEQLTSFVKEIDESDYTKPSHALSHATIGQHLRHTLEFFLCFEKGLTEGVINYDKRSHDKIVESDKFIALATIDRITEFVKSLNVNKSVTLEVGYDLKKEEFIRIETNVSRELVYNIEHAVHHMAIMKIGIREVAPYIKLLPDFGVAASTVRYKEAVASSSLQ